MKTVFEAAGNLGFSITVGIILIVFLTKLVNRLMSAFEKHNEAIQKSQERLQETQRDILQTNKHIAEQMVAQTVYLEQILSAVSGRVSRFSLPEVKEQDLPESRA